MRLSIKKATADSVSTWLQKYLDTTNTLQWLKEEFTVFDFWLADPYSGMSVSRDKYSTRRSLMLYLSLDRPLMLYFLYKLVAVLLVIYKVF